VLLPIGIINHNTMEFDGRHAVTDARYSAWGRSEYYFMKFNEIFSPFYRNLLDVFFDGRDFFQENGLSIKVDLLFLKLSESRASAIYLASWPQENLHKLHQRCFQPGCKSMLSFSIHTHLLSCSQA